jgi:hypothetical protein
MYSSPSSAHTTHATIGTGVLNEPNPKDDSVRVPLFGAPDHEEMGSMARDWLCRLGVHSYRKTHDDDGAVVWESTRCGRRTSQDLPFGGAPRRLDSRRPPNLRDRAYGRRRRYSD